MPSLRVRFKDGRDYPIIVQAHSLAQAGRWLRQRRPPGPLWIITHPSLDRLYGPRLRASLKVHGYKVRTLQVPEGEASKRLSVAERLIGDLLRQGADRDALLLALGGGVIGDLTGFVAGTFMRGVPFIQVPTTLLAQVDASVGGKVAVNHALGKNLIGLFNQPELVLIDPQVLQTLSPRQFRSGLAEVIKTAAILDPVLFRWLETHMTGLLRLRSEALTHVITRCCQLKARIIMADERDQGPRAWLNYGHTVGHALEAYHQYRGYLHGEAVAVGMVAAAKIALGLGLCSAATAERQEQLLHLAKLPTHGKGENIEKVMKLMKTDKKTRKGVINFVLTPKIGHANITPKIPSFSVRRTLKSVLLRA